MEMKGIDDIEREVERDSLIKICILKILLKKKVSLMIRIKMIQHGTSLMMICSLIISQKWRIFEIKEK